MAEGKKDDPFTRRKCAPKLAPIALLHNTTLGEGVETPDKVGSPANLSGVLKTPVPTPDLKSSSQPFEPVPPLFGASPDLNGNGKAQNSSMNSMNHSLDLSNAHDFDIPIDIPTGLSSSLPPMTMISPQQSNQGNHPRKNLNLSDYKKRKGLI